MSTSLTTTSRASALVCDTETCETCRKPALEGLNASGECLHCEQHPTSLETLLRLSLAGVTRDRKSGRFTSSKG